METTVESQLQVIREATSAMLHTMGNPPTFTLMIDGEKKTYETTQTTITLPKGLMVSGSGNDLKIEYLDYEPETITTAPVRTEQAELELKKLHNEMSMSLLTLVAVVFLFAWFYDLLFKKIIR